MRVAPHAARVRLHFAAELASLPGIRAMALERAEALGLGERRAGPLAVAAVEVASNIVRHAQGLLPGATIELFGEVKDGYLMLDFKYLAAPFVPPEAVAESDFAKLPLGSTVALREGGFGLRIIREVADSVQYSHADGVNTVRMLIRAHAVPNPCVHGEL